MDPGRRRHPPAGRDDIPVVHVTHFNHLMWGNGETGALGRAADLLDTHPRLGLLALRTLRGLPGKPRVIVTDNASPLPGAVMTEKNPLKAAETAAEKAADALGCTHLWDVWWPSTTPRRPGSAPATAPVSASTVRSARGLPSGRWRSGTSRTADGS